MSRFDGAPLRGNATGRWSSTNRGRMSRFDGAPLYGTIKACDAHVEEDHAGG